MANPFKNVLSDGKDNPVPKSGVKNPKFDKRTGPSFSCGDKYGIGKKVAVGKFSDSGRSAVPMESRCFYPDDVL